jgi:hypothetical protein
MAGRFVYWMNVSLDLFIEREAGEHRDMRAPAGSASASRYIASSTLAHVRCP